MAQFGGLFWPTDDLEEQFGGDLGVRAIPTVYINGARVEGIRAAAQLKDLIAKARAIATSAQ